MGWMLKRWGLGLAMAALGSLTPFGALALESADCLGCHSETEVVTAKLTIDPNAFDHTAHGELGCSACHASVTAQHPDDGLTPSKPVCRDCHQPIAEEYAKTGHAVNAGCSDCHNPHAVHSARQVSGHDMNRQCAACHQPDEMATAHSDWLPQAELHLEMLPCITCHTGSENYVIALYLSRPKTDYDPTTHKGVFELVSFEELKELSGDQAIATLIDADGNGFVSLTELKQFNGSPSHTLRLKGMMTPEIVTHNLQILNNRWDCTFCHASGPGTMQTSFIALPRADGTYDRLPVEKGAILDALNGTPDFYMMGATRNASMNLLGLAIIAGGLVMPVGHGFLRFLTRKNRQ